MAQDFWTVTELAKHVRVDRRTVQRLIEDGELAAFRVGHQLRIPSEAVEALTCTEKRTATVDAPTRAAASPGPPTLVTNRPTLTTTRKAA